MSIELKKKIIKKKTLKWFKEVNLSGAGRFYKVLLLNLIYLIKNQHFKSSI